MRLHSITVHNFRGMLDDSVVLRDYALLVGANNSGKSTVADALRIFYEKDRYVYKRDRDWPKIATNDKESWIELEFTCTDDEYGSLKDDYRIGKNRLVVRRYLETKEKTAGGKARKGSIFAKLRGGEFSQEQFYGASNVQKGKLGSLIYIPAVSKVDEHTKLSGPSALRDLLTNVIGDAVESSGSYARLVGEFGAFADEIKSEQSPDGRSLASFESDFSELLAPWRTTFKLSIGAPRPEDIIKHLVRYECFDDALKTAQDAEEFGSGFQRHFIFSLIRLAPKYVGRKAEKKAVDFNPSLALILFEEPEAFLHPPQQEALAVSLRGLAKEQDRQVVCTSHSSHFVSNNADAIPSIVRLERNEGQVHAFQIAEGEWGKIVDSNQLLNEIPGLKERVNPEDSDSDMEAIKYFLWLNSERCAVFFAEHVLLVEGATERILINRLTKDGKLNQESRGVYVLDCMGKQNIHRFMVLLKSLGISHSVLHDDDGDVGWHAEAHGLIKKTACQKTTYRIGAIPGDLEVFLGVPKQTHPRPDRKPQHVLFHYERGNISMERVKEFVEIVANVLPSSGAATQLTTAVTAAAASKS